VLAGAAACLPSYEFITADDGGEEADAPVDATTSPPEAGRDSGNADATSDVLDVDVDANAPADGPVESAAPPLFENVWTTTLDDAAAGAVPQQVQAGDFNVVFIAWFMDPNPDVLSVTDTAGSSYVQALPTARTTSIVGNSAAAQSAWYARVPSSTPLADAGTNVVTATMNSFVPFLDMRVAAYANVSKVLDASSAFSGATPPDPTVDITPPAGARLIVLGAGTTASFTTSPDFTIRVDTPFGDVLGDLAQWGAPPLLLHLEMQGQSATTGWVIQWVALE
jgi:hypothetical protein